MRVFIVWYYDEIAGVFDNLESAVELSKGTVYNTDEYEINTRERVASYTSEGQKWWEKKQ